MANLLQDLRFCLRQLARQPAFTLIAVLTLAVGIGVNAVAFTVINGLLFKSRGTNAGEHVGRILITPVIDENGGNASIEEYRRFVGAAGGAIDLAAEGRLSVSWQHDGTTETAWVLFVSSNYFSLVNARPIAGQVNVVRSVGLAPSIVIGERFWRRKLDGAPLSGLTLRLNGVDTIVSGVLPESFTGPAGLYSPDVWLPLDDLVPFRTSPALQKRDARWLFMLARPTAGTTPAEMQGRIEAAAAAMAADWPDTHRQRGARFRRFGEADREARALTTASALSMGIIGLVLLLACFNVANFLLARALERQRDMGIRAALGASSARLVRLGIIEGVVIAVLAGAAAIVLTLWTQTIVGSFAIPIDQPQHVDLAPDATVLGFVALLVLIAGVLPGLGPAIKAARVDVVRVLGSHGAGSIGARPSCVRRWLVGAQIAGSTAFLAIAALFLQSYGRMSAEDFGFDRDRLLVANVDPSSHGYETDRAERYTRDLLSGVRATAGVTDVALADLPAIRLGFKDRTRVSLPSDACTADECPAYASLAVGPGYFSTMGVPLVAGREFQTNGAPAEVIVNEPLARRLWPDGRGLGETVRIVPAGRSATVIGIAGKVFTLGTDAEPPGLYVPITDAHFASGLTLVVRAATPPPTLVRPILETARAVDPNVSISTIKPMEERMAVQLWPFRTASWVFTICGIFALVLATVGLAGVVIHAVSRRRREFGVRVSIGATPRDLVADVLKSGVRLLLPGVITGVLVAAGVASLVRSAFVGVNVLNPATYLAVAALEVLIVLVACASPALRAARVDPLAALRSE